ncbi:unnamed protein product [Hydatigera taeniaeformis]|uniref:Dolichyl-diphosphooligosaccharide--protein glycosyltransferase subunit MAGT1 n=1 Tax=Hydatigena taeniaeformis TaxID=6205 RepID=A0A0R3WK57_HYDTA|nr:unnamed protein product [Hydatigera taeniaeformis]
MVALLGHSNLLPLNFEKYNEFVLKSPRNYSVILMLTYVLSGCAIIFRLAADEFAILSKSYTLSRKDKYEIFFATADYDDDSEIFASLNQNTVPVFIHFPPTTSPKKEDVYDIARKGLSAEVLAQWILVRTGVHVITRVSFFSLYWPVWIIIFYMISGQIWNSIRRPPAFHSSTEEGLVISDTDLGFCVRCRIQAKDEVCRCSAFLFPLFHFSRCLLLLAMAVLGIAMFSIFTSLCLSLFRKKNQSYPYRYEILLM